ncbi:hypothetical protein T06_15953 [Trichinella sp. T6]|nr:hypothetical protein T06_15953 [Trichinella sp. T6]
MHCGNSTSTRDKNIVAQETFPSAVSMLFQCCYMALCRSDIVKEILNAVYMASTWHCLHLVVSTWQSQRRM